MKGKLRNTGQQMLPAAGTGCDVTNKDRYNKKNAGPTGDVRSVHTNGPFPLNHPI